MLNKKGVLYLKEKLIKISTKVVRHSRYVIFQMAEVAVPGALFREILYRIRRLMLMAIGFDIIVEL